MVCNVCNSICSGNHKNVHIFFQSKAMQSCASVCHVVDRKNITNTLTIIELIINNLHNTNLNHNLI